VSQLVIRARTHEDTFVQTSYTRSWHISRTGFHTSSWHGSLIIIIKPKAEYKFCVTTVRPQHTYTTHFYEGWNFNSGNYLFTTDTK